MREGRMELTTATDSKQMAGNYCEGLSCENAVFVHLSGKK